MRDWLIVAFMAAATAWVIRVDAPTWIVAICVAAASGMLAVTVSSRIVAARRKRQ